MATAPKTVNDLRQSPNDGDNAPSRPFQFSIRQILAWTFALAVLLAALTQFDSFGWGLSLIVVAIGCMIWGAYCGNHWFPVGLVILCTFGFLATWTSIPEGRGPSRRSSCQNNLKQFAIALHNYHADHGTFPPAYIADANGKPMHSWRVLILPYIEEKRLYDRYNFNEPWDGPNNRLLEKEMPRVFACPCQPRSANGLLVETNYLAVVGPDTAWPGTKAMTFDQISDGTSNTLLVVEVHDSGISWLEPRDLHISQMATTINPLRGQGISSRHGSRNDQGRGNCAMAVFCDGHTEALRNELSPDLLQGLLTARGGEDMSKLWDR